MPQRDSQQLDIILVVGYPVPWPCPKDNVPGKAILGCKEPSEAFQALPQAYLSFWVTQLLPFIDEGTVASNESAITNKQSGGSVSHNCLSLHAAPTHLSGHTFLCSPKHTLCSC